MLAKCKFGIRACSLRLPSRVYPSSCCWPTYGNSKAKGNIQHIVLPTEEEIRSVIEKLEKRGGRAVRKVVAPVGSFQKQNQEVGGKLQSRNPKAGFLGHYEEVGQFAFRVGDIVVHRSLGQVGVIAERFTVCQLGREWLEANSAPGMNAMQPFYSILVSLQGHSFTRHGAQSSHRRWETAVDGHPPQPVHHPDMAALFGELDVGSARYRPFDEDASKQEILADEWDKFLE
eukprot:TRINITY_DN40772_c0_g1_i1.p1 TRINITY_DN40772_c0_g1~~TRINITY_DN40772_c0_g1_i1.p1  ORF type:complete len:230 (-),score=33.53 TRINITY_DN40772_c0_g1_i1:34-723(-)